jgi:hypothetical protein
MDRVGRRDEEEESIEGYRNKMPRITHDLFPIPNRLLASPFKSGHSSSRVQGFHLSAEEGGKEATLDY